MEITDPERTRAQQITQAVVNGHMGAVEAACVLLPILHRHPELASQDDLNLVIAIESETDDLPHGSVRELWDSNALIEKDREIARCNELWGDQLRAACGRILLKLQAP